MDWQRHLGKSCTMSMFIEQWDYTAVCTNFAAIKICMRKITVTRMNLIQVQTLLCGWICGWSDHTHGRDVKFNHQKSKECHCLGNPYFISSTKYKWSNSPGWCAHFAQITCRRKTGRTKGLFGLANWHSTIIIWILYEKATSWIMDIDDLICWIKSKEWIKQKEWESIFGEANSANYINREGQNFYHWFEIWSKKRRANRGRSKALMKALHELGMQKKTIETLTNIGRSINHTTITLPHIFTKQDASDDGLGGFNCMGVTWWFIISTMKVCIKAMCSSIKE